MREILNGVSRRIENDLRDDLFGHLATLDARWYNRTRTGDIMARLTNDLGAVRMAAGPAIMYLTNTVFGGVVALVLMVRISGRLTLLAVLPMIFLPMVMLKLGRAVHDRFESVQAHFGSLQGKTIAVWGLAFKPRTDDMREAPSIPLITALQDMGAKVRAFDPVGMEQAKRMIVNVTFCNDAYSCAEGASALVIVTEWEQFRALDFARLKATMQPLTHNELLRGLEEVGSSCC